MKKLFKKLSAAILAGLIALTCVGCGNVGGVKDAGANVIQAYVWSSGYGHAYMEELANEYNAMQSTYRVDIKTATQMTTVVSTLSSGSMNPYDLYVTGVSSWAGMIDDFADLTEVINATYGNESKSIREKMNPNTINRYTFDGKLSSLWIGGGATGIYYNQRLFTAAGIEEVPRTTSELVDAVFQIQGAQIKDSDGNNVAAWAHFNDVNNGYWKYVYEPWVVQLMGQEEYEKFLYLKDENGNAETKEVLLGTTDGPRYKVLTELSKMLTSATVHKGSNEQDHTVMQTALFAGQVAMMVNGDWVFNESSGTEKENLFIMRLPVMSCIVEELAYREEGEFMADYQLSALIKAIDEGKNYAEAKIATGLSSLVESDYDRVRFARRISYGSTGDGGNMVFVPNYSTAKEGAIDFLKYMYSDAGAQAWMDANRTPWATELLDKSLVDNSNWTAAEKMANQIIGEIEYNMGGGLKASKVFVKGGKDMFVNVNIIKNLSLANNNKSVSQIWQTMQQSINASWSLWQS